MIPFYYAANWIFAAALDKKAWMRKYKKLLASLNNKEYTREGIRRKQ